jgi:hypothetical protein
MTSSMHFCVTSLTYMLYNLILEYKYAFFLWCVLYAVINFKIVNFYKPWSNMKILMLFHDFADLDESTQYWFLLQTIYTFGIVGLNKLIRKIHGICIRKIHGRFLDNWIIFNCVFFSFFFFINTQMFHTKRKPVTYYTQILKRVVWYWLHNT